MIWGVAGVRPKFFSSGQIFLAELAQESWRDLAAVEKSQSSEDLSSKWIWRLWRNYYDNI